GDWRGCASHRRAFLERWSARSTTTTYRRCDCGGNADPRRAHVRMEPSKGCEDGDRLGCGFEGKRRTAHVTTLAAFEIEYGGRRKTGAIARSLARARAQGRLRFGHAKARDVETAPSRA